MVGLNWASALIPAWKYEEREVFMKMILWLDHWEVSGTLSQCPGVKSSTMNLFPSLKKIEAVLFSFPSHHHSCQTVLNISSPLSPKARNPTNTMSHCPH